MTFEQALARASRSAPSIVARERAAAAARAAAPAAAQLPDPELEITLQDVPVTGPNAFTLGRDDFTMLRVGVSQDIPSRASRRARAGRAEADIAAAEVGSEVELRSVQIATGIAWADIHFARRKLRTLALLEENIDDLTTSLGGRLTSGSARPSLALQPARLRAEVANRRAALVAEIGRASAVLTRWTGDPAPEATGELPQPQIDRAALLANLETLPVMRAQDAAVGQAEADVRLAQAARRPDWAINASYGRRDPRFGDLVSIGASVDLPLLQRRRQQPIIAARLLEAERVRLEREAALREITAALDADLAEHRMHHELHTRARDTLFPLAAQAAALDRASYAAGTIDLGTTLITTLGLAEAELDLLDREAEAARDRIRIHLTYGTP